ncbi:MAG: DMT family transporter [Rhodobacteraceae bacterium]|nr:DMT family transporter [Paracoccaceae bacterium]
MTDNAKAILWVTLGTALFSLVYASGKFAVGTAAPFQVVFLRYLSGFATVVAVTMIFGESFAQYKSARPQTHFARAVFGCYGGLAIIWSSANMPLLDATAISLLYVIFIVALGVVLLKERIGPLHWFAIALSTLGAIVVMGARGAFTSFDLSYQWPAAIAVAGALLIAFEAILIRTLSQSEKSLTVLLHVNFFGIFLVAIPTAMTWQSVTLSEAGLILLLGPLAISAQYCVIRGYRLAEVSVVGPVDYSWLIFAGILGYWFFDEVPTLGVLAGTVLIGIGGLILALMKPR